MMNSENAIEIRNLYKSFKVQRDGAHTLKDLLVIHGRGKKQVHEVLKDISLDIKKGETVALVGTNGSGKSTLLKLMTGIYYPNSGDIQINGKLTSLLELGAGFHPDFTGRENIYFNASIFGLTRKEIDARMEEIIDFSELGSAIDEPIRTYSSGMYMRLAFSVAINVDADILLIDEILAVGDQHFQEKCYAKLRELRDGDKTIVIVSHSLNVVKDLCTRAIWLYDGYFKMNGDTNKVVDAYLEQIAIDNQERQKKAIEKGTATFNGQIFMELPASYSRYTVEKAKKVHVKGWKLTNAPDAKFVVYANGTEFNDIHYEERPDVVEAFREDYSGFIDNESVGWNFDIDLTKYVDEKNEVNIVTRLVREDGTIISERNVITIIEEGDK